MPPTTNKQGAQATPELKNEKSKLVLAIVSIVISFLLAIIFGFITYNSKPLEQRQNGSEVVQSVTDSIIIGLLLSCGVLLFELILAQIEIKANLGFLKSDVSKKHKDIAKQVEEVNSHTKGMSATSYSLFQRLEASARFDALERLSDVNTVIKSTAQKTLDMYMDGFHPAPNGFIVNGAEWALQSYYYFWSNLTEEQKRRKNNDLANIVVTITHSNSIDIWKTQTAEELLTLQGDFCEMGGKIVRVFLGRDKQPSEDYNLVLERMNKVGIKAFYLQYPVNMLNFDFLWIKESRLVVKWHSDAGGESIGACEIIQAADAENTKLMHKWQAIGQNLLRQEPKSQYMDEEVIDILKLNY
jgi:uncharacterized membrane protein (DUF485 family)